MTLTHDDVTALVESLVSQIVSDSEVVKVTGTPEAGGDLYVEISVAEGDIGKVIGRQGRVIKAIRTLARAAASQSGFHVEIELAD